MRGLIAYSSMDAERNRAFIEDLMNEAESAGICLDLWTRDDLPEEPIDFILSRRRNSDQSARWEAEGIRVFNRSEVNRIANDKFKTFELATLLGIPAVPTRKIRFSDDVTSYPSVLKTVDGHGGNEVFLCHSPNDAEAFFRQFGECLIIVQPYVESNAQDVRVFMLGNEVLGAVLRKGNDSFKSNFTLGGSVTKYELNDLQVNEVQTITQALKSDYIGIDFLLLPDGRWLLNEIEDPVGARSLYETHDFSVAERLMDYLKRELTN
ncbi:ATP-grasp domain-containing protein [Sporosarcina sp. 179-K 3D1 HS]|uniref:ATP-grasp domain-containing protein n=1 Tax=Sporosarcina sp. 179-K 3D1 HS TaxID=3232169 RepID=UPI0039A22A56